jgi:hypothetical protein
LCPHPARFGATVNLIASLFFALAPAAAALKVKPISTQYIAALSDAQAMRGTNAESWGL